jgi:hypothetical protein
MPLGLFRSLRRERGQQPNLRAGPRTANGQAGAKLAMWIGTPF